MCSDSRMTSYHAMVNSRKIEQIGGSLWGGAGDAEAIEQFFDWVRAGKKKAGIHGWEKEDRPDVEILELGHSGIRLWSSRLVAIPTDAQCWAIGSGGMAAMGAMLAGATPQDAVEIAKQCDEYSGGPVQTLKLTVAKKCLTRK